VTRRELLGRSILFTGALVSNSCIKHGHGSVHIGGNFYQWDAVDLNKCLRNHLRTDQYCYDVHRNSLGTRVYVAMLGVGDRTILAVNSPTDVRKITVPGQLLFLDDDGEAVAWCDDVTLGCNFQSDRKLLQQIPEFGRIGFSAGGRYYFVSAPFGPSSLYRSDRPGELLVTVDIPGETLFQLGEDLCLFGMDLKRGVPGMGNEYSKIPFCLLTKQISGGYSVKYHSIPRPEPGYRPFYASDFDPTSSSVLCSDLREGGFIPTRWLIHDLKSGKQELVPNAARFGLYLAKNVLCG